MPYFSASYKHNSLLSQIYRISNPKLMDNLLFFPPCFSFVYLHKIDTFKGMSLKENIIRLLRETASKIEAGNSELSEQEAMDIMRVLCHQAMSKAQACRYLNLRRAQFDNLVRAGKLPKGRKVVGYNELRWYRDELDEYIRNKNKESKI